jgi:hypothetical protein
VKRRDFITLLGGAAAAWPLRTSAQERIPKIGLLRTNAPPDPFVDAFRDGMRTLGYEEGPSRTGSSPTPKTIGIVVVVALAARDAGVLLGTAITLTCRWTKSAASAGN